VTGNRKTFEVPRGRIRNVAPGLPTTDMARTVEHYSRLGFSFSAPGSDSVADADFAIAERDGIALHFALKQHHDPARTATWVYLGVEDAHEIAAEFAAAGVEIRRPPHDTDYKMRELAYIDPDGNMLLFGPALSDATQVAVFLTDDPSLATTVINSGWPLHMFADARGTGRMPPPSCGPSWQPVLTSTPMRSRAGTTRPRCTGLPATTTPS
jgi:predicted enzyme related to lactoylglutathione lyase